MKHAVLRWWSPLALAALLTACGQESVAPPEPALPKLSTFTVAAPRAGGERHWDGVVEAVQQSTLSAQTAARVASVAVDVNDRVEAGQVLLRLSAVEQQAGASGAQAQLRAAQAQASEAEANYRRYADLAPQQYVSKTQLDQARAARDSAIAARDAARAVLMQASQQSDYTVVRAPYAGVVARRHVEPGEAVQPGQPLIDVIAPGALRVELQLPEREAEAIRAAGSAELLLDDGRRAPVGRVIVYPYADAGSHSTTVRVDLTDTHGLKPGDSAKLAFVAAPDSAQQTNNAVRIPSSALLTRSEVTAVYVIADGRLQLRQLRLGERSAAEVEVLAGLKPGDVVAADPLAALQALATQRSARND